MGLALQRNVWTPRSSRGHEGGISPGRIVLALTVGTLSGRTPLFRLPQAFAKLDTELLLGEVTSPEKLNDDAVGRVIKSGKRLDVAEMDLYDGNGVTKVASKRAADPRKRLLYSRRDISLVRSVQHP